jgi:3-oxoadipate enol-lactonase
LLPGRFGVNQRKMEGTGPGRHCGHRHARLFAPGFQGSHPELMAARRASFLATDPAVFIDACTALATLELRDQFARLAVPVLVMVGADDEATPPPMARELAASLPNAELAEMPGLAHVPQLQDKPRFAAAVAKFLDLS